HELLVQFTRSAHQSAEGWRVEARVKEIAVQQQMPSGLSLGAVRFDAILDQIEDACAVVDRAGNYRYVNYAFSRLFGRSRESLLGTNFAGNAGTDSRVDRLRDVCAQVWKTGAPVKALEY